MHTVTEALSVVVSRGGLSEILIGSALKGVVVLLVCLAILAIWKRSAAATRHVILSAGLVGCLLIPLASALWIGLGAAPLHGIHVLEIAQSVTANVLTSRSATGASLTLPGWWGLALIIWALGAALLSARALSGVIRVRFLLRRAHAVDDASVRRLFDECLHATGIARRVQLLVHPSSRIPFTCGMFRPTVVLTSATMDLTHDEIRRVLLHELAHVKRFDVATNMAAQAVFVLYWFNPLVWLAVRQMDHEQERACDDCVLASGEPAAEYAELLLNFARALRKRVAVVPEGITFVRVSLLAYRIQSLFNPEKRPRSAGRVTLVTLAITTVALVGILSCVRTPTTDNAPTSEAAKTDIAPSPDEFVEIDEMPIETFHENPEYPPALAAQGIGGELWVQALVDQTGKVSDVNLLKTSGHEEFDDAARAAAFKNEYRPAIKDGKPVSVWVSYKVVFKLGEKPDPGEQ